MTRAVPKAALDLVKVSEGYRATRNPDPVGYPEIGYGHKLAYTSHLWNASLSEAASEELALNDLGVAADQLTTVLGAQVSELTEGQWAAVLDFTFNLGIGKFEGSTLCAKIKTGQLADCAEEFGRWVYGGDPPVKLPGLVTRRVAETNLWLS